MIPQKTQKRQTYWNIKCDKCDQHPMSVFSGCNWRVFRCACETNFNHRKHMDFYWPMSKHTFTVEASQ